MKSVNKIMLLILCSFSFAACDTMTNQDVGVIAGGVAGGILGSTMGKGTGRLVAIGAGSAAGAYFGGQIGRSMDHADRARMMHALEENDLGQPTYWRNARTHVRYKVVPTKNVTVHHNPYCREYQTTAIIDGRKETVYGTACRQANGQWKATR